MQRHPRIPDLSAAFLLAFGMLAASHLGAAPPPPVVPHVDLKRYLGEWYEIRKIPNRFQSHCAGNTTATYKAREDGRLEVINRCLTGDGAWDEAKGVARITDPTTNAKLEVSFVRLFGWNLFWGDYWIVDLAADYSHVIVGHPQRSYGWILSRTPTLTVDPDPRLRELGYDPADFEPTPQGLEP
ncbi:MAG TPA: lipocalin family protein [Gammaproteobacteria bacterium]